MRISNEGTTHDQQKRFAFHLNRLIMKINEETGQFEVKYDNRLSAICNLKSTICNPEGLSGIKKPIRHKRMGFFAFAPVQLNMQVLRHSFFFSFFSIFFSVLAFLFVVLKLANATAATLLAMTTATTIFFMRSDFSNQKVDHFAGQGKFFR
jgi:hypothetical protein